MTFPVMIGILIGWVGLVLDNGLTGFILGVSATYLLARIENRYF